MTILSTGTASGAQGPGKQHSRRCEFAREILAGHGRERHYTGVGHHVRSQTSGRATTVDTVSFSREDNRVAKEMQCATHGECQETFVCTHLLGETAGLGFNRNEPTKDNPFPDAWVDNCALIRSP